MTDIPNNDNDAELQLIEVWLDTNLAELLDVYAAAHGLARAEAVVQLIETALKAKESRAF
jgi:hypothetical protein